MGTILSQRDIDFLLSGARRPPDAPEVEGAGAAPPEVRSFSFLHPERFSAEQRASLDVVHRNLVSGIAEDLAIQLNLKPEVRLAAFEVVPAPEVLLSMGSPCAAFLFRVGDGGPSIGLLDLSRSLAFGLLDRALGGEGETGGPDRALSPLEQSLLRGLIDRLLSRLRDAWKEHAPVGAEVVGFESNAAQCDLGGPESRVFVSVFDVEAPPLAGRLTIALPMARLGLLASGAATAAPASAGPTPSALQGARRSLSTTTLAHARVTLAARLPQVMVPSRSLSQLREGSILQTDHTVETPVEVYLNGRLVYHASLGQIQRRLGLRITQAIPAPVPERPVRGKEGRVL